MVASRSSPAKHQRKAKKKIAAFVSQVARFLAFALLLPCIQALYCGAFPRIRLLNPATHHTNALLCVLSDFDCTSDDPADLLRYMHAVAVAGEDSEILDELYIAKYCGHCRRVQQVMFGSKGLGCRAPGTPATPPILGPPPPSSTPPAAHSACLVRHVTRHAP